MGNQNMNRENLSDEDPTELGENGKFKIIETIHDYEPRTVYICEDKTRPDTKVRIKAIPICHQSDFKTAQNEAELTFILEGSPFIVRFMELFDYRSAFVDTIKCIVTEQVNGPTLEDFLEDRAAKSQKLSEREGHIMCAQLISAVSFCHSRNVVHRGISPVNVWVKNDGISIKLGDFSSAKQIEDTVMHRTKMPKCNVRRSKDPKSRKRRMRHIYNFDRAPESGNELQKLTFNTDSWTIGICVSYISAGYHPFWGETQNERLYHLEHYKRRPARLDNGLDPLVANCLIVDPERRIPNACLMKDDKVLKPFIHKLELGIKPVFLLEHSERNEDIELLQQELRMVKNQNQELMNQNQLLITKLSQRGEYVNPPPAMNYPDI